MRRILDRYILREIIASWVVVTGVLLVVAVLVLVFVHVDRVVVAQGRLAGGASAVRAPSDGRIERVLVRCGDVVHPGDAPLLRLPYWGGRLLFGGSETAARHTGYLEGALLAAARLAGELGRLAMAGPAAQPAAAAAQREATLERLRTCVQASIADWRAGLLAEYRRQLHVVLSGPHGGGAITQRVLHIALGLAWRA